MWNLKEDGITHINVYSQAKTPLGRWLSNFAYSPIQTEDGFFSSVEGYWYWLGTNHKRKDELRYKTGWRAKKLGRELKALDWQSSDNFKEKIKKAISYKLNSDREMLNLLKDSTLPLAHYYVYYGKVIEVPEAQWILDYINSFRNST